MQHSNEPLYETTTDEGVHVKVDAPDVPATLNVVKEKAQQALSEQNLPSNEEITKNIEETKKNIEKQAPKLDPQGKKLASDLTNILDVSSKFIEEKNKDDKLQKLVEETREAVKEAAPIVEAKATKLKEETKEIAEKSDIPKEGEKIKKKGKKLAKEASKMVEEAKPDAEKLQADTQELLKSLRTFFWNFVKSEDFRVLTSDWISFIQFLTTKKIKQGAKRIEHESTKVAKEGKQEAEATANIAKAVAEGLQQTETNVSEKELEDRTRQKFFQLMNRVQSKPEYQQAMRDFYRLLDIFRDQLQVFSEHFQKEAKEIVEDTKKIASEMKEEAKEVAEEAKTEAKAGADVWWQTNSFWKALYDLKDIVGQFTGQKELDNFLDTLWDTYNGVMEDPELNKWFSDFRDFVSTSLEHPDSLRNKKKKQRKLDALFTRGRELFQKERWESRFDELNKRFQVLVDNIQNDSTSKEFGEKIKQFGMDLVLNKKGYPDINVMQDSLVQLKNMLVPMFKEQLAQIKIGKVEFRSDTYDATIEDIGFSGSFLPEQIDFHMRNDSHVDTQDSAQDYIRNVLQFRISNICPELRNFKFHYNRKTFPKIEDWGVADMKISGASIQVTWSLVAKGQEVPTANLTEVRCDIGRLDLKIVGEKTHHDILDKMLLPFVTAPIKHKISTSIEDLLRTKLTDMNNQINDFFKSRPLETLKEKANEAMEEGVRKIREQQKSVSAV